MARWRYGDEIPEKFVVMRFAIVFRDGWIYVLPPGTTLAQARHERGSERRARIVRVRVSSLR